MINQPATTANQRVGTPWKEQLAGLIRLRPMKWLMAGGLRLFVPGHRIGMALVAFNARDEVLMLRHVFHPEVPWGLPGGWLERNEDPIVGLRRELHEETGLKATVGPVALISHRTRPSHLVMAYLGWVEPGPLTLSAEILEARWFPVSELPEPGHPFTREAIAAAQPLRSLYSPTTVGLAGPSYLEDNRELTL